MIEPAGSAPTNAPTRLLSRNILNSKSTQRFDGMTEIKIPRLELCSEANSNEHYRVKSKRHKIQKHVVWAYMKRLAVPAMPITVTLVRGAPRPYDDDNIRSAFKYVRDAVSEYILGEVDNKKYRPGRADNDPRIKWEYSQEKTIQEEHYIKILVESRKPDLA